MRVFDRDAILRSLSPATLWGYLAAVGAVAVVTGLIAILFRYADVGNVSMLYLVVVLVAAVAFGRGPAILASVASVVAYDWFFIEPRYTLTVAGAAEWLELLLSLLVAVITSQLAAEQRRRASEAEAREREAVILYDVARLLSEPDLDHALQTVAERLRSELRLPALVLSVESEDSAPISAQAAVGEPEAVDVALAASSRSPTHVLGKGPAPSASQRAEPGRLIRLVPPEARGGQAATARAGRERVRLMPIRFGDRQLGSITLVTPLEGGMLLPIDNRLLSAVSAQLGLVVERRRLRQEVTEAEIIRRSDEQKTALLNAVSHDLRTPLASILASSESLLQEDVDWTDEDRHEFAESIRNEALRLNRVVGNLLDLSRIGAGSLRPQKGWYDVRALVDDVLGRLRPVTAEHPVSVEVPEDLPPVELDYVEIDVVLSNLIENAAKYTPASAPIEISARVSELPDGRPDDQVVEIEVADRGPGVPEAALTRIFDPFYRVPVAGPRPRGTGLGLAVARGLVEAHGGQISAVNRPGGGAAFTFTLPLGAEQPAPSGTQEAAR